MAGARDRFTTDTIIQLLREEFDDHDAIQSIGSESNISDDMSNFEDFTQNSDSHSYPDDALSTDESGEDEAQVQSDRISKNGFYWKEDPPSHGRARSFNILRARPGPIEGLFHCIASPQDAFHKFISCNIVEEVLHCTNLEGRRVAAQHNKTRRAVDKDELLAFIGLVLLAGVEKSWDVPARELFCDLTQNPMYRAAMSIGRFKDIRRYLRFDDERTRHSRLETDHMAAFTNVWKLFLDNCKTNFIPSECVTIDEQLVPFRGRCKFLQYTYSK